MGFVRTPNYQVFCNINKNEICDVMNIILIKFCKVSVCGYNKENDEKALRELEDNIEYLSSQRELKKGPYSFKRSIVSDEEKISLKSEPSEDSQ
jgi:hypothetical protein